jgi:hypothetical protein
VPALAVGQLFRCGDWEMQEQQVPTLLVHNNAVSVSPLTYASLQVVPAKVQGRILW